MEPSCESHDDPILFDLNPAQYQAVTHERGPLLILAGAGSGKTRAITRRIAWLVRVRAVHPSRILAVTFTNKAAAEMRERVSQLLGGEDAPRWMGTFHSICLRLLRQHSELLGYPRDFVIYDDDDTESLLRGVMKRMDLPREGIRTFASYIDSLKNEGLLEPPEPRSPRERVSADVFSAYQQELKANGAMDFGDLLVLTLKLLEDHENVCAQVQDRFDHVLVDEFQDTNVVQYQLLQRIAQGHRNLCVVGDDDQSIYSWRGARVENILDFTGDYPDATVVTLGANYRSRDPIMYAASRVITFNRNRHDKALSAERGPGEPVRVHAALNEQHESAWVVREILSHQDNGVALSRMAIFYRTNAQSRAFEDALRARRIPYRVVGGMKFYQRKEVKDVLAYLRLLVNPADSLALERIFNVPPRGIGAATIEKARKLVEGPEDSLLMALARVGDQAGGATGKRVRAFIELLTELALLARELPAEAMVRRTIERTGLLEFLNRDETPEGQSRVENVQELLASVRQFQEASGQDDLRPWLDRVALVQPLDDGGEGDAVNLMTVHAAKGLEFECVFVCGLEEGLFPLGNRRSRHAAIDPVRDRAALEEERRLMYVAMTRARDFLYLSYASTRMRWGLIEAGRPSIFLTELPRDGVRVV